MVLLLCSLPASCLKCLSVCSVKLIMICVLFLSLPLVTDISGFGRAVFGQRVTGAGRKSSASSSLKSHDGKSGNSCFIYECAENAMPLSPHPEMLTTKNWAGFHSNKVVCPNKLSLQKARGISQLPQLNQIFYFWHLCIFLFFFLDFSGFSLQTKEPLQKFFKRAGKMQFFYK